MLAWNRERFINRLDSGQLLPSLAPLIMQIIKASSSEDTSSADIAALIEKDPSLTIRILRLANSAFFRSRHPSTTVQHAVLRIGIHQTRLLALSLSMKNAFPMGKVGAADYRRFWRLCLYQGLIARHLAEHGKLADPEEAFTAAFTLEIGLLVFLHSFLNPDDDAECPWYPLSSLLKWEKETYGVDHREIGELILTHWKFPSSLILCQRSDAFGSSVTELPSLVRICAMASQLSAFICQPEALLPDVFTTLERGFGLSRTSMEDAIALALAEVDSLAELFEVEIDSEQDKHEIIKKAHDALIQLSQKLLEQQPLSDAYTPSLATLEEQPGDESMRCALQAIEHEIRNPLTAVGGFARRLAKTVDSASDQGRYIEIILSEAARLEAALNSIGQALRR